MRLIDADSLREELCGIYKKAAELKDLELKKLISINIAMLDRTPTAENLINTQYERLSSNERQLIDSMIASLSKEERYVHDRV